MASAAGWSAGCPAPRRVARAARVGRRRGDGLAEAGAIDVLRARAREEQAARREPAERPQVDVLVAAQARARGRCGGARTAADRATTRSDGAAVAAQVLEDVGATNVARSRREPVHAPTPPRRARAPARELSTDATCDAPRRAPAAIEKPPRVRERVQHAPPAASARDAVAVVALVEEEARSSARARRRRGSARPPRRSRAAPAAPRRRARRVASAMPSSRAHAALAALVDRPRRAGAPCSASTSARLQAAPRRRSGAGRPARRRSDRRRRRAADRLRRSPAGSASVPAARARAQRERLVEPPARRARRRSARRRAPACARRSSSRIRICRCRARGRRRRDDARPARPARRRRGPTRSRPRRSTDGRRGPEHRGPGFSVDRPHALSARAARAAHVRPLLPPRFSTQPDGADRHAAVDRLAHVVDRERRDARRR